VIAVIADICSQPDVSLTATRFCARPLRLPLVLDPARCGRSRAIPAIFITWLYPLFCIILSPPWYAPETALKRLVLWLIALLALSVPLNAQDDQDQRVLPDQEERILAFDSLVTVNDDAGLLVRETIKVQSTGESMRHGIYRAFPTAARTRLGIRKTETFEIVALSRDNAPETYHEEEGRDGTTVYFGSSNYLLPPGLHTYVFTYRTTRQLRFFPDHDELYWNATGNGWKFPIDVVTAKVILPRRIRNQITGLDGYTGYLDDKGKDFTAVRDAESNPVFRAERLYPSQGLTIVVTWPKGLIEEPTPEEERRQFVADNRAIVVGLAGLAIALLYYLVAWMLVGRDPRPGAIVPLYQPQDNLSPAGMRFLERMGFDGKAFTAAILGLAAKGYLAISRDKQTYTLTRKPGYGTVESKLAADEKTLAAKLFSSGATVHLTEHNATLQLAQTALKASLKHQEEKVYFVTNQRYLWPGVLLTALAVAAMIVIGGGAALGIFMSIWLTGWTFGVSVLMLSVFHAWKAVAAGAGAGAVLGAFFITAFSIPFLGGEVFGTYMLWSAVGTLPVAIIFVGIAAAVLFHFLLKAPTKAGRALMDRVEGFRMFLKAVDSDRIQRVAPPPEKTPELFERFLPYALALDVEHAWASQFSSVLAMAAAPADSSSHSNGYSPSWYVGSGIASFSASDFTSSFSSSFSSAVSSASAPTPSSSGSGGGGASGGGGGGGGGGGW
jgi:uncharacterized membrane protein YgcG